jgi:sigma-54 dependent transcriptional regulator, acetoin dehydrogenase operon transcriptional activator AcoR
MSLLQRIQVTTQQIAEAISGVLDIEVTIVDDTLVRIAGTGYHYATIGEKIIGQSMYQKVINNKREYVMTDANTDHECVNCAKKATCKELAGLCCPIIIGTKVIGVIGLIAFSSERQLELCSKNERLLTFVRNMAQLIAAKAIEQDSLNRVVLVKNQLETVVNFIAEGIIAIDQTAKIISLNSAAERILKVQAKDVIGFYINEVFPGTVMSDVLQDGNEFTEQKVNVWKDCKRYHYLMNAKPVIVDGVIQGAVASFWEVDDSQKVIDIPNNTRFSFDSIIGSSRMIQAAKAEANKITSTSVTVLISGESGTGKEVFAQAIHKASDRALRPFVAVNCAAIPESLIESELFGYEQGSFTGANKGGKAGKFLLADKGTLFLDEIGDMPFSLQSRLLRVLQEKVVEPLGGVRNIPVDVRIIAATNHDLKSLVRDGHFRKDLYYRLNVFPILLPPLRERGQDIVELAASFLQKYGLEYHKEVRNLSDEVKVALQCYNWPGNIRELQNTIECAVIKATGDRIEIKDLPIGMITSASNSEIRIGSFDLEKQVILDAMQVFGNSVQGKRQAAAQLGMGIATLYRKLRKYNI